MPSTRKKPEAERTVLRREWTLLLDGQPGDLLYGDVEAALIRTLGIKLERINAFRARLRHMRNLGVPPVPKTGSGRKILFSYMQAVEMLFTAALEIDGGYTPQTAVIAGPLIARMYADQLGDPPLTPKIEGDIWVVAAPAEEANPVTQMDSHKNLTKWEQGEAAAPLFFKMNVSKLVRRFEKALKEKV